MNNLFAGILRVTSGRLEQQVGGNKVKKRSKLILTISGVCAILILGAVYIYRGVFYQSHYLPNTQVENVNIGKLTYQQAQSKLTKKLVNAKYQLYDDKKALATITGKELGLSRNSGGYLKKLMANQNSWSFSNKVSTETTSSVAAVRVDQASLDAFVKETVDQANQGRTATSNAKVIQETTSFKIKPEVQGTQLDQAAVKAAVEKAIVNGQRKVQLDQTYVKPTITQDNTKLKTEVKSLNEVAQTTGTYTLAGKTITITPAMITSWISYQDGQVVVDQTALTNYLSGLNSQYATYNRDRQFKSTKRGTVTVPAGIYGWSINVSSELPKLTAAILAGKDFTRTPTIQGSGYSKDGTDIGNTYVEVDKENQHMWVYINGEEKISTDIVTGKPKQATPSGVWSVWAKERNSTLKGKNDDGSDYASKVSYWMPIDTTGLGIHDSPWQSKYGGDWYKEHGSHGCINTPPETMAKVYEIVPIGTPVLVF